MPSASGKEGFRGRGADRAWRLAGQQPPEDQTAESLQEKRTFYPFMVDEENSLVERSCRTEFCGVLLPTQTKILYTAHHGVVKLTPSNLAGQSREEGVANS